MDRKQLIKWLIPILARGLAWILAAKLGIEAADAQSQAATAAEALGALVLVGLSVWTSIRGRQKLQAAGPALAAGGAE